MILMSTYLATMSGKLAAWWNGMSTLDVIWLTVGMVGQLMFTARWFIQWIASEKARRSIVPETFWYFSFVGGLMVLAYGLYKVDPVIILGQFGVFIYGRNLYFLLTHKRNAAAEAATAPADDKIAAR